MPCVWLTPLALRAVSNSTAGTEHVALCRACVLDVAMILHDFCRLTLMGLGRACVPAMLLLNVLYVLGLKTTTLSCPMAMGAAP